MYPLFFGIILDRVEEERCQKSQDKVSADHVDDHAFGPDACSNNFDTICQENERIDADQDRENIFGEYLYQIMIMCDVFVRESREKKSRSSYTHCNPDDIGHIGPIDADIEEVF